ncbi:MAG: hydrolase [Candidatus Thiodiazotropha endolucinida]|uniref:Isochorismatase family protein n=2 Tax=Candidatus Thiodiazotropha TaxID=1913444 RepID=A0A7Z0VPX6_9GAMM|nr:hydrolase [Candidatus Thiodiazotropha endolucinida]MBT3040775.1 hydrolase [Candidatus Thiodiazotropha sp. (ex Codakia orbicularis)]MBV2126732.1 hydrolase [Candidatus Thiodiazotropha taylori]MCG7979543.1 hydrolase [Candidatus Thiodiazotropha taylori]MCW4237674.1 hydrolase [Candidatus Thiodiazotropha endolucinida]ODJ89161.1 isochorismatase family protein [Candidatus Thiodiazotropha endolucinida]
MSKSKCELPLTHAKTSQLLIINTQERLTKAMPKLDLDQMVTNIVKLSQAASVLEVPIILSEHYGKGLGNTLPQIAKHLPPHTKAKDKLTFSCCTAPGFEEELTENGNRKQVVIVGLEAHICVLQTASGLQQWGYQVFVVEDAISSRNPHHRKNALQRMRLNGVQITNSESVAFEWMGDANNPKFKEVSLLFR